jgi:hypothetical protein
MTAAGAGAAAAVLGVWEKALDVVSLVVNGYSAVLTWQYVMEQKAQRRDAESKAGASKAE